MRYTLVLRKASSQRSLVPQRSFRGISNRRSTILMTIKHFTYLRLSRGRPTITLKSPRTQAYKVSLRSYSYLFSAQSLLEMVLYTGDWFTDGIAQREWSDFAEPSPGYTGDPKGIGFKLARTDMIWYVRVMTWSKRGDYWRGQWMWALCPMREKDWIREGDLRIDHAKVEWAIQSCAGRRIPQELVQHILLFAHRSFRGSNLQLLSMVCRSWRKRCVEKLLKSIALVSTDADALDWTIRHSPHDYAHIVESLTVEGRDAWAVWSQLAKRLPSLKELTCSGYRTQTPSPRPYHHLLFARTALLCRY